MAKAVCLVKLDEKTHAALLAYVETRERAEGGRGPWRYDERGGGHAVLSSVVAELLRQVQNHRDRARMQRRRLSVRRQTARVAALQAKTEPK